MLSAAPSRLTPSIPSRALTRLSASVFERPSLPARSSSPLISTCHPSAFSTAMPSFSRFWSVCSPLSFWTSITISPLFRRASIAAFVSSMPMPASANAWRICAASTTVWLAKSVTPMPDSSNLSRALTIGTSSTGISRNFFIVSYRLISSFCASVRLSGSMIPASIPSFVVL